MCLSNITLYMTNRVALSLVTCYYGWGQAYGDHNDKVTPYNVKDLWLSSVNVMACRLYSA